MNAAAQTALRALLAKAERAWTRNDKKSISLVFSQARCPDYFSLSSAIDKRACHAILMHAQHVGAIVIEWDTSAGHQNQIKRISLQDEDKLATLLEITPRWRVIEEATHALSEWKANFPIVSALLLAWREGRKPRSLDPSDAPLVVDAARTIEHCRIQGTQDISIRRLSAQLGFDSKHIESLTPTLDLLTATGLDQSARETEEIFAELGIVKHPLPILLSGPAKVALEDGTTFALPAPYAGLAPDSIASVRLADSCRHVLSVENLTTFHELSQFRSPHVLLVYSNGMPSPSWRRFYGRLLKDLPENCHIWHWGDVDGGGFRIATRIDGVCREQGRVLGLHMMNPALLPTGRSRRSLDARERSEMERIAQQMGWTNELNGIASHPSAYEQEALELILPGD